MEVVGVLLGAVMILVGSWSAVHNDGPRFAAGFGSGYSPGTRRFVGVAFVVVGAVIALASVV